MITNINEDFILNEVKKRDYQDMLIFMFQNSKLTQITTIIGNIIEYLKNPRNYVKDVKTNLKDMLDKYNAKPKGSKRQKNELAKILDSKANYFIDISGLLKDKEKPVIPHIEEEEEPDLEGHYFRNRINKDIESLSNLFTLDSNHINALHLFYCIADDSKRYPLFNKKDTTQIQLLVVSLVENIDSHKNNKIPDDINNLMQFEKQRRQTNIETMRKLADSNQEGQQLLDAYNKSSTIDANQLERFGLLNEEFTAKNLYGYYNRSINPKDDSDVRVRNIALQLHDAIRETNIFEETTEPKNKKQLKQLIKYLNENGDREIFFNMNSDIEEEAAEEEKDPISSFACKSLSDYKTMSKRVFSTPTKEYLRRNKPIEAEDDHTNFSELLNSNIEVTKGPEVNAAEFLNEYMKSIPTGKRAGKTFEASQKRMSDLYIFENKQSIDVSKYRGELFDILINGNYRVKFSPKCATRDGAEAYCKKRFDKNGYPLYRLVPARHDTKDPLGNPICDLNGDRVEDIVIVDTRGKPVIINGYRLVKADPYKKLWQTERIAGKTNDSFEVWLKNLMGAKRTWEYTPEQWNEGKFKPEIDKKLEKVINSYQSVGLSKPKISTKITARGLWSSIFSKIWQTVLYNIFTNEEHKNLEPLKCLFSYFKVCTAIFIARYESKVMKDHERNDWSDWVKYKKLHPKSVNAELGVMIQKEYNESIKATMPVDGEINSDGEISGVLQEILEQTNDLIFKTGLGFTEDKKDQYAQLAQAIIENKVSTATKKQLQDKFGENIDAWIDSQVGGNYTTIKGLYKAAHKGAGDKSYIRSRTVEKPATAEIVEEPSDDDDEYEA